MNRSFTMGLALVCVGGCSADADGGAQTTAPLESTATDHALRVDRSHGAPAARPIAPLSTSHVTTTRPTLRWELASGATHARVELCRDRACTLPLASFVVHGHELSVADELPRGVVFWRVRGVRGHREGPPSATWELFVAPRRPTRPPRGAPISS